MLDWHIGCSGFYYRDWRGPFYPIDLPQRKWFEFYCGSFNTVELNGTFYRFPQLKTLQSWYQRCPTHFRFSVKAPRAITHYRKFNDCAGFLTSFYDTINNGLQEKLGPVLFQLPPGLSYSEEKLEQILNSLNPYFKNVLEFRHTTWWRDDVYKALAEKHVIFCGQSYPGLPDEVIINTESIYYRFHGVPVLYRSPYSVEFMKNVVEVANCDERVKEAWCYFNNDYDGVGAANAKEMMGLVD